MDTAVILGHFQNEHYKQHNNQRIAHFNSLKPGMTVLEVGAGIGDHTGNLLAAGCAVTATEVREENLNILKKRFPNVPCKIINLDWSFSLPRKYDLIYCYGTLYHLPNPADALKNLAVCGTSIIVETCVSYGNQLELNRCREDDAPTQSFYGTGCRPTRPWVFEELKKNWKYVYSTKTQPAHSEFPTDWTKETNFGLHRAIFLASHKPTDNPEFVEGLPDTQTCLTN